MRRAEVTIRKEYPAVALLDSSDTAAGPAPIDVEA